MEKIKYYIPKIQLQFNHWARSLALAACWLLVPGGFVALFYRFPQQIFGFTALLLGLGLFPFMYPLEYVQKKGYPVIFQKFVIVGPAFMFISLPLFFALPTLLGAIVLFWSGTFYAIAAIRKEKALSAKDIINGKWI